MANADRQALPQSHPQRYYDKCYNGLSTQCSRLNDVNAPTVCLSLREDGTWKFFGHETLINALKGHSMPTLYQALNRVDPGDEPRLPILSETETITQLNFKNLKKYAIKVVKAAVREKRYVGWGKPGKRPDWYPQDVPWINPQSQLTSPNFISIVRAAFAHFGQELEPAAAAAPAAENLENNHGDNERDTPPAEEPVPRPTAVRVPAAVPCRSIFARARPVGAPARPLPAPGAARPLHRPANYTGPPITQARPRAAARPRSTSPQPPPTHERQTTPVARTRGSRRIRQLAEQAPPSTSASKRRRSSVLLAARKRKRNTRAPNRYTPAHH